MGKWIKGPSVRQILFLQRQKLEVPPTRNAASRLIGYILEGNGTPGSDKGTRINIAREFQHLWVGKQVVHPRYGRGVVKYLLALPPDVVRYRRKEKARKGEDEFVQPIDGFVEYENGRAMQQMLCELTFDGPSE